MEPRLAFIRAKQVGPSLYHMIGPLQLEVLIAYPNPIVGSPSLTSIYETYSTRYGGPFPSFSVIVGPRLARHFTTFCAKIIFD
jgi:hypothetical protein